MAGRRAVRFTSKSRPAGPPQGCEVHLGGGIHECSYDADLVRNDERSLNVPQQVVEGLRIGQRVVDDDELKSLR